MENNRARIFDLQENLWEPQRDNPHTKPVPPETLAAV